jgi:hypothetical protein
VGGGEVLALEPRKDKEMPKQNLREIALEMGYTGEQLSPNSGMNCLNLDNRFGVIEDEKGLHLTDLVSWARFSPITIGRKSSVTRKGLEFQIAQLNTFKKQRGLN